MAKKELTLHNVSEHSETIFAMKMKQIAFLFLIFMTVSQTLVGETIPVEWSDSTMMLNEVSVTAIKGRNNMVEAASSVTSIGMKRIEQFDILNVKRAAILVPNFYIPDYGSRMTSSIYVRGIGARIDQPAVGLNVDNVPYLNKDNYDFDIADIDRIEVSRGPQSTLYGRNTMAGLINVYTLSPMRFQGVRVMAAYGSGNTMNYSAGLYHRFDDNTGMSVTAAYGSSSGFYENVYNGQKVDHEKNGSLRWKTVWRKRGLLSLENTASLSVNRQGGYPYESIEAGVISYNDTCFYRRTGFADGLTVNLTLPGVELSSITSFQYIDDNMTLDQDFLPAEYFTLTQRRHERAFTQDFIAKGMSGRYKWLGGLFGFYKDTDMSAPVTFKDDGVANLIEAHANQPGTLYPIVWDTRSFVLGSNFDILSKGLAVYHRSTYEVGRFVFSGSLRLDYEHVALNYHNFTNTSFTMMDATVSPAVPFQKVPIEIDDRNRLSTSFVELLPKISIEYGSPSSGLYFSVAKGYKAGGYNTQMFSDVLQQRLMGKLGIAQTYDVEDIITYEPEKSWNYELGVRFDVPSASLSGAASLFYIDCRNQQLTMFPPGVTTGRIMTNAGKTRSMGGELSLKWMPVGGLAINASYGFTDARFVRFNDGINDCHGNRVPYAPQNTLYASADYEWKFQSRVVRSLMLHGGVRGVGSIYWNETNTLKQPFYALLDASATLNLTDMFSLEIRVDNLCDYRYDIFYFMSIGNSFVQRGKPRFIGGTLRFKI